MTTTLAQARAASGAPASISALSSLNEIEVNKSVWDFTSCENPLGYTCGQGGFIFIGMQIGVIKSQKRCSSATLSGPKMMHMIDSLEPRRLLSLSFSYAAAFGDESTLDSGNAVAVDAAGNTYFGGTFQGKVDVNKSNHGKNFLKTTPDNNDAFLVKYDPTGKLLWAQRYA